MRSIVTNTLCAIASLGVTAGIVAFADPAVAATPDFAPRQAIVQTADLDLQSPAGLTAAKHRIHSAAVRVCDTGDGRLLAVGQCQTKAISDAEHALGARIASTRTGVEFAAR